MSATPDRVVYLDYNATTPLHPFVLERMYAVLQEPGFGNPSALHASGRSARRRVESAREHVAQYLGVDPCEVVFTSGGTESNNLFVLGDPDERELWVGGGEHPSVLEPARSLWRRGRKGGELPLDSAGRVKVKDSLPAACWLSVQWVNSETGIVNNVKALGKQLEAHGLDRSQSVIHSDGAQGFFRLPQRIADLGVDAATLTAHKSFGPTGVGVLYLRRGVVVEPRCFGGAQERRVRPGTENLLAIVALGALCELAQREPLWPTSMLRVQQQRLREQCERIDSVRVLTPSDEAVLPNTLLISVPGIEGETLVNHLERRGYSVGTGTACSSGGHSVSTNLRNTGFDDRTIRGALRLSWGPSTTDAQLFGCADALSEILAELHS